MVVKTIRELRDEKGLTQVQLAHEAGVTPSTVYKWEAGRVVPDVIRLRTLARLFEVSTDDIALIGLDVFAEGDLGKVAA
jgi:transcriptional regulator with XRE-family HTH domain